jgi:peptidoglycan L-alanyl-D-glutamate endopeptidase CwlK
MSLAELTADTRPRVEELLALASAYGTPAKITDALRSCADQNALYAKGRTAPGSIVTGVRGCRSWHVHGRAVDLYIGTWEPEAYEKLGLAWEKMGGVWGGRWGDHVHFEWHPGLSIDQVCPPPGDCSPSLAGAFGKGLLVGGLVLGAYVLWTRGGRRR